MDGEYEDHTFNAELERHYDALKWQLTVQIRRIYRSWNRPLDPSEVEDEVQDLFRGILEAQNNYDPSRGSFKAWANAVAMRRLADRQRQFHREHKRPRTMNESSCASESVFDLLIERGMMNRGAETADERIGIIMQELERLCDRERDVLRRRFLKEDDYAAIARDLGITEAAARGIQCRGVDRLGQRVRAALRDDKVPA
jgi:RNA polymerase sigma factor (sigma-70 family)